MEKPLIGITMGDPNGIGPEIIIKAYLSKSAASICNIIVFGDSCVLSETIKKLKLPLKVQTINKISEISYNKNIIYCINPHLNLPAKSRDKLLPLRERKVREYAISSISYIKMAVNAALKNKIQAVVTAPVNKRALNKAGFKFPGHTEFIAHLAKTSKFCMMFAGKSLNVALVTRHISLSQVRLKADKKQIVNTVLLINSALKKYFKIQNPKIAVAALNPHGAEDQIFGKEEINKIIPSIKELKRKNINVAGPFSADSLFLKDKLNHYDVFVCMYHDQGLIPFKMLEFKTGVNITLGLPFVRTSCDHGTAYDIAGKGKADPSSLIEAIKLAVKMCTSK